MIRTFLSWPLRQRLMVVLAAAALFLSWVYMALISRTDPWYRNTDMNMHTLVDALALNADVRPNPFAQPAIPLKYLLALDYRVRHELGALPIWNLNRLGRRPDPVQEFPALVHVERFHSRVLIILLIIGAAGLTYNVTRELGAACFTVILLCGCTGLLSKAC